MRESEGAERRGIFAKTQADVRKWFRRCVGGETGGRFCGVSDEARAASEQCDDYCKGGTWMHKHLNGTQSAANRTNNGVDGSPGGVDPRNLARKKFEGIKNANDRHNHTIAKHLGRLIRWR